MNIETTTKEFIKNNFPVNELEQHKGNCGKVLICGGSIGLTGAVCLASQAALKCGCGLITVGIPESLNSIYEIKLTEIMSLPLKDNNGNFFRKSVSKAFEFSKKCDAVAIGPGGGNGIKYFLTDFITRSEKPLLIDADGINALSSNINLLEKKKCDIIITPHTAEMSRLTGKSIDFINENRLEIAYEFAKKYKITVLLKGKGTVITDGNEIYINNTGNEGMATGGSGDVLSGIILSLMGRRVPVLKSGIIGAYLHGLAGDYAKEKINAYSMSASNITENIPDAINDILKGDLNDR